jgi:type II secretory pathway component GspD/PulD (secretin)
MIHSAHSTVFCEERTVIFKIQFRDAAELFPIVKDMMSKDGRASIDLRTNSIVVSDNNESLEYIRGFIERLDQPLEQLIVRVRFIESRQASKSISRARGRISGENWEMKTHEQDQNSVHIHLDRKLENSRHESEFFLNVQSGRAAYLVVGEETPFTERWDSLLRKYGEYNGEFKSARIDSGLEIRPVIIGDRIDIEIIPRISHGEKRHQKDIIRLTEASTHVSINLGQWVTISGTGSGGNDVIREILASGSRGHNSSLTISLMVTKN